MSREAHVRICERVGVRFPRPTRRPPQPRASLAAFCRRVFSPRAATFLAGRRLARAAKPNGWHRFRERVREPAR